MRYKFDNQFSRCILQAQHTLESIELSRWKQTFKAFSHYNYRLYFAGHATSLIGTWMQTLAQGWLVWRITGSPFWLGVVSAMNQLPSLMFGSFGGVLVDRVVKRKVLIITQTGMAIAALALGYTALHSDPPLLTVLVIVTVSGLFASFDAPARLAFVHDMVGKEDLGNAVALNSTTFNGARLIGPAIAGLIVPIVGEAGCFFINAASYLALIFNLLRMRNLPPPVQVKRAAVMVEWREALNFVRHSVIHRSLLLNTIVFGLFGFAYTVLLPVFADKILGIGVRGLGMLMGSVGLGALMGGIWQAGRPAASRRGFIVSFGAVGMAAGAMLFAFSNTLWISIPLLAIIGFSGISLMAATNTLLQSLSPDHLRGRVMGFYITCFLGISPIGNFAVGSLAAKTSAPIAMAVVSGFCLIVSLFTVVTNPQLKKV